MDVCFSGNKEVVTLGPSNGRFWTGCFKRTEKKIVCQLWSWTARKNISCLALS